MSRFLAPLSLSIATLVAAAAMPTAHAATVQRTDHQGAAGVCRGATTEYATRVRNRPLGVTNVSSEDVFLTCALQGDDAQFSTRGATLVSLQASNTEGTSAHALDCTLVNGQMSSGVRYAAYSVKSVTIEPGSGTAIEWTPAELSNSGGTLKLPAVSCLLKPGMTLNYLVRVYNEDVGA